MYFRRVNDIVKDPGDQEPAPPGGEAEEIILVVEDEKSVRDLTVRILRRLGYGVLVASGGDEAIAIAQSYAGKISLLLTDVVMPNMSGRQVADNLLKLRPGLKILYLSGYTDSTVVHHGVLENSLDFLPKPFSREVLARKIREILSR
jgi:CheY-like chemotaxis protein